MDQPRSGHRHGQLGCVRALLAKGVDTNHFDDEGHTALSLAAQDDHDDPAVIRVLVAADGIDVNLTGEGHRTALIDATEKGNLECARALLAANAVDCPVGDLEQTALHVACVYGHAELAELLLVAGSCRFALAMEDYGEDATSTPLALAEKAWGGSKAAVLKIFASGVDYWQRRQHGRHSWAMKQVVKTVLLARQRLGGGAEEPAHQEPDLFGLVHLPEEIWLLMCGFLRSADFCTARIWKPPARRAPGYEGAFR